MRIAYLNKDLLILRDSEVGLAGRVVGRQRVVQIHAERHVVDRLPGRSRYNPGKRFRGSLVLSVCAIELGGEQETEPTQISAGI